MLRNFFVIFVRMAKMKNASQKWMFSLVQVGFISILILGVNIYVFSSFNYFLTYV